MSILTRVLVRFFLLSLVGFVGNVIILYFVVITSITLVADKSENNLFLPVIFIFWSDTNITKRTVFSSNFGINGGAREYDRKKPLFLYQSRLNLFVVFKILYIIWVILCISIESVPLHLKLFTYIYFETRKWWIEFLPRIRC